MLKVYVTEMPKEAMECPFYNSSNKKCNICKDKCCLVVENECKHLLTLLFDVENMEEVKDE